MSSSTKPLGSRHTRLRGCLASALVLAVVLLLAHEGLAAPESKPKKVDHVTVQAFADRQAVTPGGTLHLIASLEMDKNWYVYWQATGGELGLPTEIQWSAPTGYRIGRVRFPVPERKFDKTLKTVTYSHEGTLLILSSVQVPDDATPGKDVTFTLEASWLACKKACVPGEAKVSLTLPVVAEASKAPPANLSLFEDARMGLPLPTTQAEHHALSATVDKPAVKPGDTFTATVTAKIEAKHHMQSNKPLDEGLIPAIVFVERTDGLEFGDVVYPKPHVRTDKLLGKMSEYGGEVAFKIPVTVEDDADTRPRWIRGILQSQICTESGTCYPPQHVEFAIPVRMVGGPAPTLAQGIPPSGTEAAEPAAEPSDDAATAPGDDRNVLVRVQDYFLKFGFFGIIVLAFCGGFLLNLMPCVLPVISLKVLSFVRQAHEDRWRVFRLGLTYAAGIMVFYGVLAALFYMTGSAWGQLFQDPLFVIVTAAVVLAFSLSLFGVFAVFTPNVVNELGQKAESQEGYLSAFGTGILATLLGTACTAPFLSVAIGYATQLPAAQGAWIFAVAGFGMAFPFIVLTYNPKWLRFVPRPGPWMGTFEHIMGFLLLATVIWLVNPLRSQIGDFGLLLSLIFLLAVAIAVWIKGKIVYGDPVVRRIKLYAMALIVLVVGWMLPFRALSDIPALTAEVIEHEDLLADGQICRQQHQGTDTGTVTWTGWQDTEGKIPWQRYRRHQALRFVNAGYTVFVDYTADWCASCKTNLKTSIEVERTIKTMRELNVVPFEADYTLKRPEIKKDLNRFNSAGVPLYLVYRPHDTDNPEKLPEILTPGMVIDALERAGPSRPADPDAS